MAVHGIRQFYDVAAKKQFLRDINFRLTAFNTPALALTKDEVIYTISKTLPGRNIQNVTQSFMGLDLNIPGTVKYAGSEDYKLELFVDANAEMRQKMERASRTIFNDLSSTGDYRVPGQDSVISLSLINSKLDPITTYNLVGASIRNINSMDFDFLEGTGKLMKISMTVAYQWYTVSDGSDQVVVAF